MRALTTLALVVLLALPAAAQEPAVVLEIGTHEVGHRTVENRVPDDGQTVGDGTVHWGIVGHYLWLEWGTQDRSPDSDSGNHVSINISDPAIRQVIAYADGTVEIVRAEPVSATPEQRDMVEESPQIDWSRLLQPLIDALAKLPL